MITKSFDGKTLILTLEDGVDDEGNPKYIRKSIRNIRETATSEEIHAVAQSLAPLFSKPVSTIAVDEDYVLTA